MFDGWCCPGPGGSWGNLAVLPASKDAESPSKFSVSVSVSVGGGGGGQEIAIWAYDETIFVYAEIFQKKYKHTT